MGGFGGYSQGYFFPFSTRSHFLFCSLYLFSAFFPLLPLLSLFRLSFLIPFPSCSSFSPFYLTKQLHTSVLVLVEILLLAPPPLPHPPLALFPLSSFPSYDGENNSITMITDLSGMLLLFFPFTPCLRFFRLPSLFAYFILSPSSFSSYFPHFPFPLFLLFPFSPLFSFSPRTSTKLLIFRAESLPNLQNLLPLPLLHLASFLLCQQLPSTNSLWNIQRKKERGW